MSMSTYVLRTIDDHAGLCTHGGATTDKMHCKKPKAKWEPLPDYCLAHYAEANRTTESLGPEPTRLRAAATAEAELARLTSEAQRRTLYEQAIEELEEKIAAMTENPPRPRDYGLGRDVVRFHEDRANHARQLAEFCTALAAFRMLAAGEARGRLPFRAEPMRVEGPPSPFRRQRA